MSHTKPTANSVGFYSLPGLFAGTYTITFSAPGMRKHETIYPAERAGGRAESQLSVGQVTESVTVSADTIQLATYDSGTVSTFSTPTASTSSRRMAATFSALRRKTTPGLEADGTRANGLMGGSSRVLAGRRPMTNRNFGGDANTAQSSCPILTPCRKPSSKP